MSITPADVAAQQFPIAFRGYQVEAVDQFLDRLQHELTQMPAGHPADEALTDPVALAVDEAPQPTPDPTAADRLPGDAVGPAARALRTLQRAEQLAEQMMSDATTQAEEMLGRAKVESEQLMSDVSTEAEEMLGRARVESETIVASARAESSRLDADLNLRRQREVGALMVQAQQVQAEIDRLRDLERRYRDALQALLSEQQRLLEQRTPGLDAAAVTDVLRPAA